jgi:hypothetical protein
MSEEPPCGWVYIMRNPSMPNLVKIGSTANDPAERARQLSVGTGIPTPFCVVRAFPTVWYREAEQYFHEDHRWCRVSPNRDFFLAEIVNSIHMTSDADYDQYYSLVIQNIIKVVEKRMELRFLRERVHSLEGAIREMEKLHETDRQEFLDQCWNHKHPEQSLQKEGLGRSSSESDALITIQTEGASMAWNGWHADMPVLVLGVRDGKLTDDGRGSEQFATLTDAQAVYPDLDPHNNTKRFTAAMAGGQRDGREWVRFETWQANTLYST